MDILYYLKALFLGKGQYLGMQKIPLQALARFYRSGGGMSALRASQHYQMGISLGTLTRIGNSIEFAKALDTLTSEYDVYLQETKVGSKSTMSRVLSTLRRRADSIGDSSWLLEVSIPPFPLDFIATFLVLVNTLLIAYEKLEPETRFSTEAYFELVTRLDARIWKLILVPVLKDVDVVAAKLVGWEMQGLLALVRPSG
ncbi:hypothetical protein HDU91_004994 [Kappamyces sp. JEL0680]|nr:hypothetical protein HDU91_004994 [Kappamyces sp. JEL0680]